MGNFTDPIVGGVGTLIRAAIRSANYVAGISGWQINRDGSAEFSSAVMRGELDVGTSPNPRIQVTTTIPATLIAASTDFQWSAGIFKYVSATDYTWEAVGTFVGISGPFEVFATGTYDTNHGVTFNTFEQNMNQPGRLLLLYGSNAYNTTALTWSYRHGTLALDSTTALIVEGAAQAVAIDADISGTTETWHAVTFQNGWANAAGGVPCQYRRVPSPANNVQIVGELAAGNKADATTIFTLPAGYQPAHRISIPVAANPVPAGSTTPLLQVQTTGAVQCFGLTAATAFVYLDGRLVPLDA